MARGMINEGTETLSKKLLGQEISQEELRLLPYLMSCLLDGRNLDHKKLTNKEEHVMELWHAAGYVIDPYHSLTVDSEFYDAVVAILKVSYCKDNVK